MIDQPEPGIPRGFATVAIGYALVMACNFLLTTNPYAALHSGDAAKWAQAYSTSWRLHAGMLMTFSLVCGVAAHGRRMSRWGAATVVAAAALLVLSGSVNGAIQQFPATYFFMIFGYGAVVLLAYNDSRARIAVDGRQAVSVMIAAYFLSVVLALVRPGVWGHELFGFSRAVRGEATFAVVLGLPLVLAPAYLALAGARSGAMRALVSVLAIVEVGNATRVHIWFMVVPFLLYALIKLGRGRDSLRLRRAFAYAFGFGIFGLVALGAIASTRLMTQADLAEFLTGRLSLWEWHWRVLLDHPWFGAGVFPLERLGGYAGRANTEIGLLAAFSQFGVGFGLLQVLVVMRAVFRGFSGMLSGGVHGMWGFCALVVPTMLPVWLFGGGWRVLNAYEFVFWYSVAYVNLANRGIQMRYPDVPTVRLEDPGAKA